MREFKIEVKQEVVNYIEKLQFEVMTRQDVITSLLENHAKDDTAEILEGKVFQTYSKQLSELKAEYELAKSEMEKSLISKELQGHKYDWNLDFSTCMFTVAVLCRCVEDKDEETV